MMKAPLEDLPQTGRSSTPSLWRRHPSLGFAVLCWIFVLDIFGKAVINLDPIIRGAALVAVPLALVSMPLFMRGARKRNSLLYKGAIQKIYFIAAMTVAFWAIFAVVIASLFDMTNIELDFSRPMIENTVVVSLEKSHGSRHTSYYVHAPLAQDISAPSIIATTRITVDRNTYYDLRLGDAIEVGVKKGLFGFPWVSSFRKADATSPQPPAYSGP